MDECLSSYETFPCSVPNFGDLLVNKCFPKTHPLDKIINRQTVKIGYSTTHNKEKNYFWKKCKIS